MNVIQPFFICDLLVLFKESHHVVKGLVAVKYPQKIAHPRHLSRENQDREGCFVSGGLNHRIENTCRMSLL